MQWVVSATSLGKHVTQTHTAVVRGDLVTNGLYSHHSPCRYTERWPGHKRTVQPPLTLQIHWEVTWSQANCSATTLLARTLRGDLVRWLRGDLVTSKLFSHHSPCRDTERWPGHKCLPPFPGGHSHTSGSRGKSGAQADTCRTYGLQRWANSCEKKHSQWYIWQQWMTPKVHVCHTYSHVYDSRGNKWCPGTCHTSVMKLSPGGGGGGGGIIPSTYTYHTYSHVSVTKGVECCPGTCVTLTVTYLTAGGWYDAQVHMCRTYSQISVSWGVEWWPGTYASHLQSHICQLGCGMMARYICVTPTVTYLSAGA